MANDLIEKIEKLAATPLSHRDIDETINVLSEARGFNDVQLADAVCDIILNPTNTDALERASYQYLVAGGMITHKSGTEIENKACEALLETTKQIPDVIERANWQVRLIKLTTSYGCAYDDINQKAYAAWAETTRQIPNAIKRADYLVLTAKGQNDSPKSVPNPLKSLDWLGEIDKEVAINTNSAFRALMGRAEIEASKYHRADKLEMAAYRELLETTKQISDPIERAKYQTLVAEYEDGGGLRKDAYKLLFDTSKQIPDSTTRAKLQTLVLECPPLVREDKLHAEVCTALLDTSRQISDPQERERYQKLAEKHEAEIKKTKQECEKWARKNAKEEAERNRVVVLTRKQKSCLNELLGRYRRPVGPKVGNGPAVPPPAQG